MKQGYFVRIGFAKKGVTKIKSSGQTKVHDFSFFKKGRFLDYITRPTAVHLQDVPIDKNEVRDVLDSKNIKVQDFFKPKFDNKKEKSGAYRLFSSEPNDLNINLEKKLLANLDDNQTVWEMTINPGDIGVNKLMYDKYEWNKAINKTMKKFLKANDFNPEFITGHWVIHTNTDYPHVHLSFWETTKNYINDSGELVYRSTGFLNKRSLDKFKSSLLDEFDNDFSKEYDSIFKTKSLIWNKRNHLKALLKSTTNENALKEYDANSKMQYIYESLRVKRNKTYALAEKDVKTVIWSLFDDIKEIDNEFKKELDVYQQMINTIKNKNPQTEFHKNIINEFIKKENEEFDSQIGNIIIKLCFTFVEQKEKEDNNWFNKFHESKDKKTNWKWILSGWEWEANKVWFIQKQKAIKKFKNSVEYFQTKKQ